MAERRMFAKTIIDSDAFLDMPLSTQALYFHLSMRADDEGFINNPKKVKRMIGASDDDLKLLIAKNFVIPFETGVVVIKHWRIHNYIRSDRLVRTVYKDERDMLELKENGAYTVCQSTDGQVSVNCQSTDGQVPVKCQHSIGKDSIGKVRLGKDRLVEDSDCSEPQSVSEPEAQTAILILNDGSEWRPTVKDYEEWCRVYPNVDVFHEFERMRQWCISNPKKRKTQSGIRRFVTNWLDGEQNKPRKQAPTSKLDMIDQWAANMERKSNEDSGIF